MFTTKHYVCDKCGHIYKPLDNKTFIKTSINPCPNCGSSKVAVVDNESKAKTKSNKIKDTVKGTKSGVMIKKVQREFIQEEVI